MMLHRVAIGRMAIAERHELADSVLHLVAPFCVTKRRHVLAVVWAGVRLIDLQVPERQSEQ